MRTLNKLVTAFLMGALFGVGSWVTSAQGPLTAAPNLRVRTDGAGSLITSYSAMSGSAGPLTAMSNIRLRTDANGYLLTTAGTGTFTPDSVCLDATNQDVCLERDAANTLAQRRTTNAQTLRVYGTYTDASNYERLRISAGGAADTLIIQENAGTGTTRGIRIYNNNIGFGINPASTASIHWQLNASGHIVPINTASYDLGASATTVRSLYTSSYVYPGSTTNAALGTPANGAVIYCSDCTIANPCAGSGTGALAKRLNSTWVCN